MENKLPPLWLLGEMAGISGISESPSSFYCQPPPGKCVSYRDTYTQMKLMIKKVFFVSFLTKKELGTAASQFHSSRPNNRRGVS
jgi:hypothetical protein